MFGKRVPNDVMNQFTEFSKIFDGTQASIDKASLSLGNLDKRIVAYASTCKDGQISTDGFRTYLESTSLSAKATEFAITTLRTALNMLAVALVMEAISWFIKQLDHVVNAAKYAKEAAEESAEKAKSLKEEIKSLNEEMKTTNDRIHELEGKEHLTFVEQEELDKLKEQNKELEREIKNRRILGQIADDDANESAKKYFNSEGSGIRYTGWDNSQVNVGNLHYGNANWDQYSGNQIEVATQKLKDLKDLTEEYNRVQQEVLEFQNQHPKDYQKMDQYKNLTMELKAAENQVNALKEELPEVTAKFQELDDSLDPNTDKDMLSQLNNYYDQYFKLFGDEGEDTTQKFDEIWDSKSFESTRRELEQLASSGKLSPDVLSSNEKYKKLLDDTGKTAEEVAEHINALADAEKAQGNASDKGLSKSDMISKINGMSEGFEELDKIMNSIKDKKPFDYSLLDDKKFKETFQDVKGYADFVDSISNNSGDLSKCKKSFNDLVTEWIKSTGILNQVTDDTAGLTKAMLENMGVTNASTLVTEALQHKQELLSVEKEYAEITSRNLANATVEEVNEFLKEEDVADEVKHKIAQYYLEKVTANGVKLDTVDDVNNIMSLIKACGGGITALQALANAKKGLFDANQKVLAPTNPMDFTPIGMAKAQEELKSQFADYQKQSEQLLADAKKEVDKALNDNYHVTTADYNGGVKTNSPSSSKKGSGEKSTKQIDWTERHLKLIEDKIAESKERANSDTLAYLGFSPETAERAMQIFDQLHNNLVITGEDMDWLAQTASDAGMDLDEFFKAVQNGGAVTRASSWEEALENERAAIEAYTEAAEQYRQQYEEAVAKLGDGYRDKIEGRGEGVETLPSKDGEEIERVASLYDKMLEQEKNISDAKKQYFEDIKEKYGNELEYLEKESTVLENQNNLISKQVDYLNTSGRLVTASTYEVLIGNLQKQQSLVEKQLEVRQRELKALMEQDPDYENNPWYYELEEEISSSESSLIDLENQQAEYNDTLRQLPVNNLQKLVDMYNDISTALDNQKNELEAAGKVVSIDYYKTQISNGEHTIRQLERQREAVEDVMDEYEEGSDKWIEMNSKLNEIDSSISSINVNISEWNDSMAQIPINNIQKLLDLYNNVTSAIDNMKSEIESKGGLVPDDYYKAQIQNGQEVIAQLKEQRIAVEDLMGSYEEGSDKWNDMYSKLSDIDSSISSVTVNINEWTDAMRQIPLNNLEKVVDLYNSITTALDNYKNENESAGRIVSNDYYKNQIANGNKIISQLKDEKKIIEGIIGFYEVGSDKWTELNSKLNDVNSTISSITSNINEWNETLKQIPLNNIQKVVDAYNDISSALDNQKSLYESSGGAIGAGYYEAQIKNGQKTISQLNSQKKIVENLMKTYETGSDKWIEMNSKLNEIDSSIASITGNIAEWNDALKQLPVNTVQKLIDLYNQFSTVFDNQKNIMDSAGNIVSGDYYQGQISNGEKVLEQLQKQREYVESILSTYEVGSDKWIEMNSKLNDIDSSISSTTVNINQWKETLAQLPITNLQKIVDLCNQLSTMLDNRKNEMDSAGSIVSNDYYEAQISNGERILEQLQKQREYAEQILSTYEVGSDKWTEMNSQLNDIDSTISSTTVNINQWKEALAQLPINNLQKIVDLYTTLSSTMDNRKSNIESAGGVVSNDYYKYQIENAQKNIEYLKEQREAVEKLMSTYEIGSDKWTEMNSQLSSIDSTISGLVDNINDWSDTLRRLPLDNIEKLLDALNNISTAVENRKNEVESAGGIVSADYYQALIQNGQDTLEQLEKQKVAVKEVMRAYEEGSDKWIEMNSKLTEIDSSISSIIVNTNEWKDALKQLPITNLQKIVDMYDKLSTKIQNWGSQVEASGATLDKDYYQALISNGQSTIEQLQKQAEAIKSAMSGYEVGSDKWTDMYNQLQDIDSSISSIITNMHQWNQSILQLPLNRLDSLINDLQTVKDALDEVESEHNTVITAVTNAIQKQKDDLQDAADEQLDALNKQKEALQDQLDLLQDQNEALKRQREYEQALKDLEDAKEQKTKRVIRDGKVVYEADQDAIVSAEQKVQDAKDALDQQKIQDKIDDIDDSIDDINDVLEEQLKALTKIYDKWNTITEEREAYTNGNVANRYLGEDWLNKVLTGSDEEIFQAFKDLYNQNEDTKDQYEEQIESSQKIQTLINTYITAYRSGNITRDQAITGIKGVLNSLNHEMTAGENVQHILNFLSNQNNTGATTNDILTDTQNKMMDTASQIQNSLDIYEKNSNTIVEDMSTFGQLTQDIADIHVTIDAVQSALQNHTATMEGDFTKLQESMKSDADLLDSTLKNNADKSDKNFADLNNSTNLVKDSIEKNTSKAESGFSEIGSKIESNIEALKENTSKTDSGFTNLGTKMDADANTLKESLESNTSKTDQGFANLGTKLDSNANNLKTSLDNNTTKTDSGFATINNTMNSTANSLKTALNNNASRTDVTNLKNTMHADITNVKNTLDANATKQDKSFSNLQDRMSDSIKSARQSLENALDDGFDDVVSALGKIRNSTREEKNYDEDKESSTSTKYNGSNKPSNWQTTDKFDNNNGKNGYEVGATKRNAYADGIEKGAIGGSNKEKFEMLKALSTTDLEKDEHPIIAHTGEVVLNPDQQKQLLSNYSNLTPDMLITDTRFDYKAMGEQLINNLKRDGMFQFDWIKQQHTTTPTVTQQNSSVNVQMGDIVLEGVQDPDQFAKAFKNSMPSVMTQVFARR